MIISRADIPTDVIVQYPGAFMRVPIANYLKELELDPLPSQIALVNGINNPKYRFGCAALSRRQGKTYIANIIGQVVSLVPGSNVLVMAPNYNLSSISFDLQRSLIKQFGIEVIKDNAKDRVIELVNGSTIRIGSVNQVDSCVGRSYDLIIFDEAALTDGEEAFNVSLRPTLDKPNSKAIFISTPRGKKNWFSKFFDRGFSDEFPQWFSVKATWKDNPRMTAEDVDEARRSMSEAEFRQEYEADFSTFEGKIWDLKESQIRDLSELDTSRMDKISGLDVGFRDPTAQVVVAFCPETETFYIVDEYQDNEKTTAGHAVEIERLINEWEVDFTYIDSANQQMKFDFAQQYGISMNNAKKDVLAGISYISALCDNDKIVVSDKCKHVLYSFDQYQWDNREGLTKEKPVHNEACHMADAIRYAIYSYKISAGGF
jgi:phage terminase large subunit